MTTLNSIEGGRFYGIGTGPGDPELITLKAARLIASADVVAYFCKRGKRGNARDIADAHIHGGQREEPMVYPVTTELPHTSQAYRDRIEAFFDASADMLAGHLAAGRSVVVLNEGDPFFYGSFMHVYLRLKDRFPSTIIPGVPSIMSSAALLPTPLTMRDDVLSVVPGTLPDDALHERLSSVDAAVIMKVGSNLDRIVAVLERLGMCQRAWYVERSSMAAEYCCRLPEASVDRAPYFSMIVVPGTGERR
ncbi:precorrin-2 C(20)-methyltransferase [Aquisalimonas asiatica]|uniref:Precorrin-2/cobalt-factor-2 C20-methyltransferase n=1 Tax=Aquisalimonas asiatica TaxID=406100 RepID=A0A1H8UAA8_9GAMM|nr:precorrin-2 C(20)-methyltransferase [Aquisalimonas asiatica]SEO99774.1 precorrin-2/cobalt-factor-2 C20-methyltransferase [Aquisalimonas asiatica]